MPARKVSLDSKSKPVKKAGLAALMPDKSPKGVEERKKAVKRMFKTESKLATKSAKTKTVKKATKAKVATSPQKSKILASKPVSQSVPKKQTVRVRSRAKSRDSIAIERNLAQPEAIVLPDRVSVRAQEKVLAILSTLTKDFRNSAEKVSYVAGFCFIMFGAYLSLSFSGALPQGITPQVAQLLTGTTDIQKATDTKTSDSARIVPKPTFSLLDPFPPVIDSVSKHTIEITNSELVDVRLFSLSTGEAFDTPSEKVVDNTFRITIDPESLSSGRYTLKATLKSSLNSSKYEFKVGEFEVKQATDLLLEEPISIATSTEAGEEVASSTEQTLREEQAVEEKEKSTITITVQGPVMSGRTIISLTAPTNTRVIELYVRPLKSSTKRFVGLAEKYTQGWRYFLDTKNIPNGEYEVVARSKVDGQFLEASSQRVTISNFTATPEVLDNSVLDDGEITEEPQESVQIDPANARSFSDISLYSFSGDTGAKDTASTTSFETASDIEGVISQYKGELEEVLERYAVAKQSEDTLMLELVENELLKIKTKMVQGVLLDPALNELGDDVDTVLTERFVDIKRRVDTFEELRRTATERASAIDRDGDGISDFDETNLYQTDPDKSDTDNDGVTDGIEIMRGFDPLDPVAEVIVSYEMPQDTVGLVEDTVLKVEGVAPVVKTDDPTIAPVVQAEIRGKGLPNSFVTLYVFSSPTIVTVRTGEDGSFVYRFEKELEDGEHEVYVAVTDNTGAIMARSNPFRFIKQAEAFSPIGGTVTPTQDNSLTGIQIFGSFNVAIGLGILALGMILLILGATLRERQGFLMTSPKNDVAVS